jgi:hypothetical protein
MQELTGKLLNCVGERDEQHRILEEYREFLLEPLEDQEAVLVSSAIHVCSVGIDTVPMRLTFPSVHQGAWVDILAGNVTR